MNFLKKIFSFFKGHRIKVPVILQMEATECGAASLAMILAYFGRFEPLEKLRVACGVSRNGSNAGLVAKAANTYGLEVKGFQAPISKLDDLGAPLILFWEFNHYVVYTGRSRNGKFFYINDPAMGIRKIPLEQFKKSYTGIALSFKKTPDFKKGGKATGIFEAMLPMLKGMQSVMAAIIWGGLLLVLPAIIIPTLMRIFVDKILPGKVEWLIPVIFFFALAIILQSCLNFLVQLALRRGELQLAVNKTLHMIDYLFHLPAEFFMQRVTSDVQSRVDLNATVAKAAFGTFADNIVKLFTAIFFLVLMFQFSALLSVVALSFVLLQMIFFKLVNKARQNLNQALLISDMNMINSIASNIDMMENLKASGRENSVFIQWAGKLAERNKIYARIQNFTIFFNAIPTFLTSVGNILILSFGAYEIINGKLTLGGMFAFQTLMTSFITPFSVLLLSSSELQSMKANVDRINDVYKYEKENIFKPEDGKEDEPIGSVAFEMKDISFGYSRLADPILTDFSLKVESGKRVALVGGSGSGKTTIAKLANGILAPWTGQILLNGKPLSEYKRSQYSSVISSVDQSIMMFSGTVGENLTLFAPKYNIKELHNSIKDAYIDEELNRRGKALELPIKEHGTNFSGGQRQRLEIARAFTYKTPLLILDEATSALDPITELEIDRAIRRRGCSCIIVAHRLSTIRDCDEIIMLSKGKIVERGTHEELIANGGEYAKLMNLEQGA